MKFQAYALLISLFMAPALTAETPAEQKINKLVAHFLDIQKHPAISWECFAKEMSDLLRADRKPDLSRVMRDLMAARDSAVIGKKMLEYKNRLAPSTLALLERNNAWGLLSIIDKRLQTRQECANLHKDYL